MSTPTSIYRRAPSTGAFRQGEIVSNLIQARIRLETIGAEELVVDEIEHEYAVVVSQDCDLDWDWDARKSVDKPAKLLSSVLFCEAKPADELAHQHEYGRKERNILRQNRDERYQFLQMVEPDLDLLERGVPELVVDFKRYFCLPVDEVYARLKIEELKRRCLFNDPYLQHLISRFCYFQSRVALPEQHFSEPYVKPA